MMDKIRKDYIRGTSHLGRFGDQTRQARLWWFGHVRVKYVGYTGGRMLMMELPGERKRGTRTRSVMDVVRKGMAEVEVTEEDAEDRTNWRKKTLRRVR